MHKCIHVYKCTFEDLCEGWVKDGVIFFGIREASYKVRDKEEDAAEANSKSRGAGTLSGSVCM